MKMGNHVEQEVVDQAVVVVMVPVRVDPEKVEEGDPERAMEGDQERAMEGDQERAMERDQERVVKMVEELSMDVSLNALLEITTATPVTAPSSFSVLHMDLRKCHALLELDGTKIS